MRRRSFLATPLIAGLAPAVAAAAVDTRDTRVFASGDGIPYTPQEHAALLTQLTASLEPDDYSRGGVVETLEKKVAAALGKETAVWLPTGTLANHLALRLLAGDRRRVMVQQECHLYNDCGDCCQTLSGLNMIPLAPAQATFTLADVESAAARGTSGRVAVPLGALQIESPVRRRTGEAFDWAEMKRITAWGRANRVGLHLDGARLFLAAAYSGVPVRDYAALFDTVYVSMYKYFNAPSGAMLAGPKSLLENLFHTRRMFGGGVYHSWPSAAVALHHFDGFPERFARAVAISEKVLASLSGESRLEVRRVPNGTNIFFLRVRGADPAAFGQKLRTAGVIAGQPREGEFTLQVNETWNRATPEEIAARFRKALS